MSARDLLGSDGITRLYERKFPVVRAAEVRSGSICMIAEWLRRAPCGPRVQQTELGLLIESGNSKTFAAFGDWVIEEPTGFVMAVERHAFEVGFIGGRAATTKSEEDRA